MNLTHDYWLHLYDNTFDLFSYFFIISYTILETYSRYYFTLARVASIDPKIF